MTSERRKILRRTRPFYLVTFKITHTNALNGRLKKQLTCYCALLLVLSLWYIPESNILSSLWYLPESNNFLQQRVYPFSAARCRGSIPCIPRLWVQEKGEYEKDFHLVVSFFAHVTDKFLNVKCLRS